MSDEADRQHQKRLDDEAKWWLDKYDWNKAELRKQIQSVGERHGKARADRLRDLLNDYWDKHFAERKTENR